MTTDEDSGWPAADRLPSNILRVYRAEGAQERAAAGHVPGMTHEGRLFMHDKCTGQRVSYTAGHVNTLLTATENPERIKERIVELVPRLSAEQKRQLAQEISAEALAVVRSIDANAAELIASADSGRHKPAHKSASINSIQ